MTIQLDRCQIRIARTAGRYARGIGRRCPSSLRTAARCLHLLAMNNVINSSTTQFTHVKPGDTPWRGDGLRDFFEYRDLGVAAATNGQVIAHLGRAKNPPEKGTGWHRHEADFQIVLMLRGWAKFMYEDQVTMVEAGDCVHQRPGIAHFLFEYSPDMEYLEIVGPADFKSIDVAAVCDVPAPRPWN